MIKTSDIILRLFEKHSRINLFILVISLLNMLQSLFTPITQDEAYYWMFSKNLEFGYFDHPPLVALLIKIGTTLFSDTLIGIRLMTVILYGLTLKIIWELVPENIRSKRNVDLLFILIVSSVPIFQVYSFITTPDVPLLFFSALYIYLFIRFEQDDSWINTLLLAATSALLIYSKYHGGILIIVSVLLQLKILKKPKIYIVGFIAAILLIPHFLWQYDHDFITFRYHLFERSESSIELKNILGYVASTIGVLNPALILLLGISYFKKSKKFIDQKYVHHLFIGILFFFLLFSFRSKIEAHWVAIAAIPLVILILNYSLTSEKHLKTVKTISLISLVLMILARIAITIDLPLNTEFHTENRDYFLQIDSLSKGRHVVYVNSYQRASKHYFYTGENAFSDNNAWYRKNQYDILDDQNKLNDAKILLIGNFPSSNFDSLVTKDENMILYDRIDAYPIFSKLKARITDGVHESQLNRNGKLQFTLYNPYPYAVKLDRENLKFSFSICFVNGKKRFFTPLNIDSLQPINPHESKIIIGTYSIPDLIQGTQKIQITLQAGELYNKVISDNYEVIID